MQSPRFLRIKQVCEMTALSRSEIYRRVQAGTFPHQRRLSHRHAVWQQHEIEEWMQSALAAAA